MTTEHNNGSELDPNPIVAETPELDSNPIGVETPAPEVQKLGTLDGEIPIEECVEKITLVCDPPSVEGNDSKSKSESESESESSESENSSSSSSSDSGSGSSSGSDSDDEEARDAVDREVEEGEVSSSDEEKMVSWSAVDEDIDDDGVVGGGPIRSKNEIRNLPPVPAVDVTIEPHHQMLPVGVIMSVIGAKVIVEGVEKHNPLNEGSIIWLTESRKPLGLVDEIFGPVKNPYYVVRYNSENEVPVGISGGTLVSFVPEFANHVLNGKDLYNKGYDASGMDDEELSDEYEFSDDEKEAEYKKMQKMAKRGVNDQNRGNKKNNKKKFLPKDRVLPTPPATPLVNHGSFSPFSGIGPATPLVDHGNFSPFSSIGPATPLVDHGNFSPFSGIGQGQLGGTTTVPPFPPSNAGPNFATNGVWTNGNTLPQQPQPAVFPNGFPTNGISCYPQNTQFPHQMPMPVIQFQQQMHPSHGSLFPNMLPGAHPNIFAQPMYAQGLVGQNQMTVGQNQMTFGLSSPYQQMRQPAIFPAQQGFPPTELQSERNLNFHSSSISGSPSQFRPGSSPSRGRKPFRGAGRKGWRPAK